MLARLSRGPCSVTTLGEPFGVTAPAISKHLRVLERAGLIDRWKAGRVHYCRLKVKPLDEVTDWIEQHRAFWEQQLDALASFVDEEDPSWPTPSPRRPASPSGPSGGSRRRAKKSSARGRNRNS